MAASLIENDVVPANPGISYYSLAVTGGTLYTTVFFNAQGGVGSVAQSFVATSQAFPDTLLTTLNATVGTLAAGKITGAGNVTMVSSNATPGAQTVRTAAQMLADIPGAAPGLSYNLRITNTGAGTLTLTADGGATVTLSGTMTVPQNTFRDFVVTFNTATTATITAVGTGTYS